MTHVPLTELAQADLRVELRRVETPKGIRLELRTPDASLALDAVELEALSWQSPADVHDLPHAPPTDVPSADPPDGDDPNRSRLVTISNEFGFVVVYEGETADVPWVEFVAKKQHSSIRLNAAGLAAVAKQDHDLFTAWIAKSLHE